MGQCALHKPCSREVERALLEKHDVWIGTKHEDPSTRLESIPFAKTPSADRLHRSVEDEGWIYCQQCVKTGLQCPALFRLCHEQNDYMKVSGIEFQPTPLLLLIFKTDSRSWSSRQVPSLLCDLSNDRWT